MPAGNGSGRRKSSIPIFGARFKKNPGMKNRKKSITEIFREGTPIDEALRRGVREALKRHIRAGVDAVEEVNGKIVWVTPREIKQRLEEWESEEGGKRGA